MSAFGLHSHRLSMWGTTLLIFILVLFPLVQEPALLRAVPDLASVAVENGNGNVAQPPEVALATTSTSWNPNVSCAPTLTTFQNVTGSSGSLSGSPWQVDSTTGGVPNKRALSPPCTINNIKSQVVSTLVQINAVYLPGLTFEDCATSYDPVNGGGPYPNGATFCDNTGDIHPISGSGDIHIEFDRDWQAKGFCGTGHPPCDNSAITQDLSSGSISLDVQGFVYWDIGHWELHPFTAWKLSSAPPPVLTVGFTWSPSTPQVGQTVTFTASVSGGTPPDTFSWNFGDGSTSSSTTTTTTHSYSAQGSYSVTLKVTDSTGLSGQSSNTVTVQNTTSQSDFSIAASPTSLTVLVGPSVTSTIKLSSLNSFSGTITLSASVSPSGPTASLSQANVTLSSGGTSTSTLSFSSASAGAFTVTVTGTSGSLFHSTSVTASVVVSQVASDSGLGPSSIGIGGGQRLIQDSAGRLIAVYVDSSGRIGLSYDNSNPAITSWSTPVKSPTPASAYAWPSPVLVSLTSLQVIVAGGSGSGMITDIPVAIQRDSQNNIIGFSFGTPALLDSSGLAGYPSAVLAHNGNILLVWGWLSSTSSQVKSLRWDPSTTWTNFAGSSTVPDTAAIDNTILQWMIPHVIERADNFNVYVLANRLVGSSSVLYNKAAWNGSTWSWGTATLNYETNASDGGDDPVALAWDPIKSVVVASFGISGTTSYGVFTLSSSDLKTHLDTPTYAVTERGYGGVAVHITTGDYYIFFMNVNGDDGQGTLGYVRRPAGGSWSSTFTLLDSNTDNQGLSVKATGIGVTLDLLYVEGTSTPTRVKFTRLSPLNPPNFSISPSTASLTVQSGSTGTSSITLASLFNFTGTVSLSATVSPTGLAASLSQASVTLSNGGTATSTLAVSSTAIGTYTVTVAGTSGSLTHSAVIMVVVTDFTLSAPSSLTVIVGSPGTSAAITLTSVNSFTGTIGLTTTVSSTSVTASLSPTSVTLASGGTGTSMFTVSSGTVGTYTVTVKGTAGSLSHSATISIKVVAPPDFSIAASPTTVTFNVGTSGSSTATVTSLNGFTGTLTISRTVSPSTGLSVSCSPTSITLSSGGSGTSACSFTSSTMGTYSVTVSASNGTLTRSALVTVNVADFSIAPSPLSLTILAGSSGTSTLTMTSLNSFSGTVSLSLTPSAGLTASLSSTSLPLTVGGTGTSTLTVTSSTIGNYTVTVTASGGSLAHTVQVTIRIVDFAISSNTASVTIDAGQSSNTTITLNSLGGFAGSITLTTSVSPSGLASSVNPTAITLVAGGSGTSSLTVSSTVGGTYAVTVTGTSGSVSHSLQVMVRVLDFSISASPSTTGFQSGSNASSTITITSQGGFAGTVSLGVSTTPSAGLAVSCNPLSVALTSGGSAVSTCVFSSTTLGTYTVSITGTSSRLVHTATVTVGVGDFTISSSPSSLTIPAGSSGTSSITLNSLSGFTGTITLSTSVTPNGLTASASPASVSLSPGGTASSSLTVSSSSVGNYTVTVTGTIGSLSHSLKIGVQVVDFSITTNPPSLTILAGSTGTSSIQLASVNGFTGTVALSTSVVPTGLTASATPTSIVVSSGASASSTLTVTSSTVGNYTVTVMASSGSLTHPLQLIVHVVDFTISASPALTSVPAGSSGNSTVTLTSLNGLSGSLSLTAAVSPSGLITSLNPASDTLSPGGSSSSTLIVSSPSNVNPGTYTVTITASIGTHSHAVTVTVNVPDFTITSNPASVSFTAGSNSTSTISLTSLGGFTGKVGLAASSPSGVTVSISPASLTLSGGGSSTSVLTLSSTTSGTYTVTVTGTSGAFVHSVTVTVKVADFGIAANPTSLNLLQGQDGNITITLTSLNGFAGTGSLSSSVSPTGPRLSLKTSTFSLSPGGSGTTTLKISTVRKDATGTYTVTIVGASGSLSHSATVVVTLGAHLAASFITASPTAATGEVDTSFSLLASIMLPAWYLDVVLALSLILTVVLAMLQRMRLRIVGEALISAYLRPTRTSYIGLGLLLVASKITHNIP